MSSSPPPRLLLSIDYEPWFVLFPHLRALNGSSERKSIDDGFSEQAVDRILDILGSSRIAFYIEGEIVDWYPKILHKICSAGHEIGLHCHTHEDLLVPALLKTHLEATRYWRERYGVVGYRAPQVKITEQCYPLLASEGLLYSSSIYAATDGIIDKDGISEIPVSTRKLLGSVRSMPTAPRALSLTLLRQFEFPFGSSLASGISPSLVIRMIEKTIAEGRSPVVILHPIEIFFEKPWTSRAYSYLYKTPYNIPFLQNKLKFFKELISRFPTSTMKDYLEEWRLTRGNTVYACDC